MPDVLSMLDGLTHEHADAPASSPLAVADADLNSAVLSWMIARPDGIQADRPDHRRIGMRDVRAIKEAA